jgi:hypothetical protein
MRPESTAAEKQFMAKPLMDGVKLIVKVCPPAATAAELVYGL